MSAKFKTTVQPANRNDEIEVTVEYDYHKGSPGRLSGPPERCYPPEPAYVEIINVMHGSIDIEPYLSDDIMMNIEYEIEAAIEDDRERAAEARAEWIAEHRREEAEAMQEAHE